ncbi:hypothetical protein QR680_011858 [Steinernema hermaphroditum]|uniref:Uncharacterized protein n=1 Tax=Steinernema hermaphroditum TaxID=289476 RepID=A0AA39I012_9BILA|nr:hypothetical protein QR680_011858 [Steinernema hermaphroditum]
MQFTAYVIEFLPIIACAVFALDRALVLALPVLYGPWRIRHRLAVFVTVFEIGFIVALYIVNFLLDEVIYALEDILQVAFFGALFFETVMYAVFIFILRLHHKRVSTTLSSENKQTNHIVLFQAIIHTLLSTIPNAVSTAMYFMPEENDIRDPVIDVVKACILLLNIFSLFIYMRRPPQTSRFTTLAVVFVTHIVCSAASLLCYVAAILDEHYYRFFYNEEVAIVVNVTGFLADFLPIIACAIFALDRMLTNHIVLFQAVIHTLLSTIPNAVLYSFMFLNAEEALPGFVADLLLLSSYLSMAIISVFTLYKLVAKKMPVKVVPHTNIIPIS